MNHIRLPEVYGTIHMQQPRETRTNESRNRRRRSRMIGDVNAWLVDPADPDSEVWEVRVKDFSRYGVGFDSFQSLELGETTRLRIGRGPLELARHINVVRCVRTPYGAFRIGAAFC